MSSVARDLDEPADDADEATDETEEPADDADEATDDTPADCATETSSETEPTR